LPAKKKKGKKSARHHPKGEGRGEWKGKKWLPHSTFLFTGPRHKKKGNGLRKDGGGGRGGEVEGLEAEYFHLFLRENKGKID